MSDASIRSPEACPFIDEADPRCDDRFTLGHLSEAFGVCVGAYRSCPTYWHLARQRPQRLTVVTAHGRSLRPTGS